MGLKKYQALYHHRRVERALTILELLLAVLLSCLVGLVLFRMYYTQDRTYSIQSEISEMQQNLRVAVERVLRDLTMAGFAQPAWTTINGDGAVDFSGIKVTGGNVIDLVGSFDGVQGVLAQPAAAGSTRIKLSPGDSQNFKGERKLDISIGGMENAKIVEKDGNTLTIDTDPQTNGEQGLLCEYPAGTEIYLVIWKTYWVDDSKPEQPVLRVDEHLGSHGQPLALFITGVKVALSGRMAQVTVTGRTRNPDRATGAYIVGQYSTKILMRNMP